MRLNEFVTPEEWSRLEQLIFDGAWTALDTYQKQRAALSQQQAQSMAQLQPRGAHRKKQLARKVNRAPHAAPPRQLPRPKPVSKKLAPPPAVPVQYNPVKAPKPLPAPSRTSVEQPENTPQEHINLPPDMDQRGRAMLPKSKRGPNIWDLVNI